MAGATAARDLAADLDLHCSQQIEALEWSRGAWTLVTWDGSSFEGFDAVVLAAPAPQTLPLLPRAEGLQSLAEAIESVEIDPCQAVLVGFEEALDASFDAAFVSGSPIAWAARNGSKPERPAGESWIPHATPKWSRAHLEEEPDRIGSLLLEAFAEALRRPLPAASHRSSHRWRYARTRTPLSQEAWWKAEAGIGVCGDWLIGERVEDAFLSGRALARQILAD